MASNDSCNVCCSKYNKSTHSIVKCYFTNCAYEACKECVRTYLTNSTNEPHCMKCRNKWHIEFSKSALNASFMDKDYRTHRRTILADMAVAKIPEYYESALRYGKISALDKRMEAIMEEINIHRAHIHELYREYNTIQQELGNPSALTARKFVMPCQNTGCRGMLSTQYKCDICSKHTCSKCFVVIGDETHECKQEDVDSVEELRKNTRPCPNCGLRISKIDGCDQMWCVECKTAFSWNKGTIEQGVVHNPHYYQWMREHGTIQPRCDAGHQVFGQCARNITQIVNDCEKSYHLPSVFDEMYTKYVNRKKNNEFLDYLNLEPIFEKYLPFYEDRVKPYMKSTKELNRILNKNLRYLTTFHRYIVHMEHVEVGPLTNNIRGRAQNNRSLYEYILNRINKDQMADELIRDDTTLMRDRAYLDIIDALVLVGKQILMDCLDELNKKKDNSCIELAARIDYARRALSYRSGAFIQEFVLYEYMFTCDKMADYHKTIVDITDKYVMAIKKYCAYSNAELLRFLLVYNSKKTLYMWNYVDGNLENKYFKNKKELTENIEYHHGMLKELENINGLENEFIPGESTI